MPTTPGTLAEYDMMLCVSEAAMNKQLQMLYDHKLEDADFRPAHPVDGGLPAAPAKYAINHEWNIQLEKDLDENNVPQIVPEIGIFAHIQCPQVSFSSEDSDSAIIRVKFMRDPSVPETSNTDGTVHTSPDSRFYYYAGTRKPVLKHIDINDWTLTWQVKLRQKEIEDVMKDIVARHDDPNDPTYLPPGLSASMKQIDPRLFTVSSIFCVLEDTLFVNTVQLLNADQVVVNGSTPDMTLKDLGGFVNMVNLYFRGIAEAQRKTGLGGEGIPNPDSPFVLGYGLSQDVQAMTDVNNQASWENSPAYFIPNNFHLSTTRGSADNLSTLNFCMLNHTSHNSGDDHPRVVDPDQDHNAGRLTASFFDQTKVNFGDGIMAWSQDIFWRKWIVGNIVPIVYIDPYPMIEQFLKGRGVSNVQYQMNTTDNQDNGSTRWARFHNFKTNTYGQDGNWMYGAEMWVEGSSSTTVDVTSDFTNNGLVAMPPDRQRCVYIKCAIQLKLEAHFETYAHVINAPRYRAYTGDLTLRYEVDLRMEAGKGGVWSIVFANDASQRPRQVRFTLPSFPKPITVTLPDIQDIGDSLPSPDAYGAWAGNHEYNNAHIFSPGDIQNQMKSLLMTFGGSSINDLADHLQSLLRTSNQNIMMPGGEVFTFNGLDTDNTGQLFVHVNYALGAEGTSQT